MTLPATLLALVAIVALIGGAIVVDRSVRDEAAAAHTRQTLDQLNRALRVYHAQHEIAPTGSASEAIDAMRHDPQCQDVLAPLRVRQTSNGAWVVLDGFGRPLRYRAPAQPRREAAIYDAEFVSAGADGRFGDVQAEQSDARRAAADNIRGSDLSDVSDTSELEAPAL